MSAMMDSDLAWVNGKSGRHSWCYADAFKRFIISGAIYRFILNSSCAERAFLFHFSFSFYFTEHRL